MANIQLATVGYKHKFSHVVVQLINHVEGLYNAPVNNHWFYFSSIEHVRHSVLLLHQRCTTYLYAEAVNISVI